MLCSSDYYSSEKFGERGVGLNTIYLDLFGLMWREAVKFGNPECSGCPEATVQSNRCRYLWVGRL